MPSGVNSVPGYHGSISNSSETFQFQNSSSSWADRSEEDFASNVEDKNIICSASKFCNAGQRNPLGGFSSNARYLFRKVVKSVLA